MHGIGVVEALVPAVRLLPTVRVEELPREERHLRKVPEHVREQARRGPADLRVHLRRAQRELGRAPKGGVARDALDQPAGDVAGALEGREGVEASQQRLERAQALEVGVDVDAAVEGEQVVADEVGELRGVGRPRSRPPGSGVRPDRRPSRAVAPSGDGARARSRRSERAPASWARGRARGRARASGRPRGRGRARAGSGPAQPARPRSPERSPPHRRVEAPAAASARRRRRAAPDRDRASGTTAGPVAPRRAPWPQPPLSLVTSTTIPRASPAYMRRSGSSTRNEAAENRERRARPVAIGRPRAAEMPERSASGTGSGARRAKRSGR